jgi:hypothetical protein
MTLAEVMLIILFCLLLLLGKYFSELSEKREQVRACGLCSTAEWAAKLTGFEVEGIGKLTSTVRGLPEDKQSDTWQRLTDELSKMILQNDGDQSDNLRARANEAERKTALLKQEAENLRKKLDRNKSDLGQAKDRGILLEEEIRKIKAGSPPPCMHEPPTSPQSLIGPSISLGVVHIEDGRTTLVSKNLDFPSLSPVDFIGKAANFQEAHDVLGSWPLNKPLSLQEFGEYGREYIRIGNDEFNGKLKCRFTMDYYIKDGVPIDMLVKEFELYFYKQHKLTVDEFNQIR